MEKREEKIIKESVRKSTFIEKKKLFPTLLILLFGVLPFIQRCGPVERGEEISTGEKKEERKECPSVSYSKDLYPILKQKCAGCHTSGPGSSFLSSGDPSGDYSKIKKLVDEKEEQVGESKFIAKASGKVQHGGGAVITEGSDEYLKLKCWIEAGAPNN